MTDAAAARREMAYLRDVSGRGYVDYLEQQLAAATAREARLREALWECAAFIPARVWAHLQAAALLAKDAGDGEA